jgi:succinate dehydrogenase / fumarate reductase, cytochrome b subunit
MAGPQAQTKTVPTERPLSPHLQVWRWHVTMATSIFHRASGVGLYVGAIGLTAWLITVAIGPEAYAQLAGLLGTLPGQLALYAFSVAAFYHLANGVRHLVWDAGKGFKPKTADASGWFVIIFALVAPVGLWALASL